MSSPEQIKQIAREGKGRGLCRSCGQCHGCKSMVMADNFTHQKGAKKIKQSHGIMETTMEAHKNYDGGGIDAGQ